MLYARINKEYINQDELAKKIVFERTISQVNRLYKDQPEVAMKPGQLSSQLKYGFDSLFTCDIVLSNTIFFSNSSWFIYSLFILAYNILNCIYNTITKKMKKYRIFYF